MTSRTDRSETASRGGFAYRTVGDAHFQDKCLARLDEDRRYGRTFLVATHALSFVEERCDRAAVLVEGRVVAIGASKDVVREYRETFGRGSRPLASRFDA
jgi:ABC-type polysaccharide/polyol phosphate transport system ATPase subunit